MIVVIIIDLYPCIIRKVGKLYKVYSKFFLFIENNTQKFQIKASYNFLAVIFFSCLSNSYTFNLKLPI